jgi:hypothetical protein
MPVLDGKLRNSSIAASNPPAEPPMPTIGHSSSFATDLACVFLRDGDALVLGGFLGGMSFFSMNRNTAPHKVEGVLGNGECLRHLITAYPLVSRDSVVEGRLSPQNAYIVVVGTSAGGVEVLCELHKYLPENLDASIFVAFGAGFLG